MWPIKEIENKQLLIKWPNLIPYSKLQECVVTVLLLTSTSLTEKENSDKISICFDIQNFQALFISLLFILILWLSER